MNIYDYAYIGVHELRKNLTALLEKLGSKEEGIIVTQNGQPEAVLLSLDKYQELKTLNEELEDALRELKDTADIDSLKKAVSEIKAGKGKSAFSLFKELGI